jgi:hypothetical protein
LHWCAGTDPSGRVSHNRYGVTEVYAPGVAAVAGDLAEEAEAAAICDWPSGMSTEALAMAMAASSRLCTDQYPPWSNACALPLPQRVSNKGV